ncbi:MAG: PAS domain-containing protein, partial [Gammaproteobacteria bacterium]
MRNGTIKSSIDELKKTEDNDEKSLLVTRGVKSLKKEPQRSNEPNEGRQGQKEAVSRDSYWKNDLDDPYNVSKDAMCSQEYLMQILAQVPGNVYWKNKQGKYEGCNNNQLKIAKFNSLEEIIGKTDYELYDKKIADAVRKIDIQVMQSGKEHELEEIGIDENGNKSIYLTKKSPLFDKDNNIVGILGVSLNISDRINAEKREKEAIQAMAEEKAKAEAEVNLRSAVTILAGSIAHDLRTPLTAMSITTDLFQT